MAQLLGASAAERVVRGPELKAGSIRRRTCAPAEDFAPDLHPVLRRVYAGRGVRSVSELSLGLDRLLPVSTLDGIDDAVALLLGHFERQSRILVIGDFDADGATSSALVVRGLRRLGFHNVGYLVPNRFRFGYGLTPEIVALAAESTPSLIITVDNGISSHAGASEAERHGIQVLITDHHLPPAVLPRAAAIVNPNIEGAHFASRALAGVGVAFYVLAALARALRARGPARDDFSIAELLDLVALGTVADMVPLDHNNRILVAQGLKRLRAGRCVAGIAALLEQAGRSVSRATAQDLAFAVAPRLNAAGRLDDMSLGVECLLTDDLEVARKLAARLTELNEERREIELRMQSEALTAVERLHLERRGELLPGLCLYDETWHQGVIGLVAARVKDRVQRPVIALARADDGTLRGSARSVPGVHIRDVLEAIATRHPGLIERFGGHAMAAGLTLQSDRLDHFTSAFTAEVGGWLDPAAQGIVETDGELGPDEMTLATALALRDAGPWGSAFPEPAFDGEFMLLESRIVGERHLKMRVRPAVSGEVFDAIAFRYADDGAPTAGLPRGRARLAYRLDVNEYLGTRRLQLVVEHLVPL
jgi:single-stranded-DNA-specific exonuclease